MSTVAERRALAQRAIENIPHRDIRQMARKHWKSETWIRRFIRHTAYWQTDLFLKHARNLGYLPTEFTLD